MRLCRLVFAGTFGLTVAGEAPPRPEITTAPSQERVLELVKRQTVNDLATCGFYNGSPNSALTCSGGRPCGYDTVDGWL